MRVIASWTGLGRCLGRCPKAWMNVKASSRFRATATGGATPWISAPPPRWPSPSAKIPNFKHQTPNNIEIQKSKVKFQIKMQKPREKAAVLFSIRTKFQAPNTEHKHSCLETPSPLPWWERIEVRVIHIKWVLPHSNSLPRGERELVITFLNLTPVTNNPLSLQREGIFENRTGWGQGSPVIYDEQLLVWIRGRGREIRIRILR